MSDCYNSYTALCLSKQLSTVQFCEPEFHYLRSRNSQEVLFAVKIPYPLFRCWHEIVQGKAEQLIGRDYVDLFEWSVTGSTFVFVEDEDVRQAVNSHLAKYAGEVASLYRKTKGRGRKELDERVKVYHVKKEQIKAVTQWKEEIGKLEDIIQEWRENYDDLQEHLRELHRSLTEEINKRDKKIDELQEANEELKTYVARLENGNQYKGKSLSESSNKNRTLKCFLTRAQSALWFSKSFGIDIEALILKNPETGQTSRLPMNTASNTLDRNTSERGFDKLTSEEKSKIEKVLFLLDKFCVGDRFYHEFTYVCDGLPKSHLVQQCRTKLNDICHLDALPGSHSGARVYSVTSLIEQHIKHHLHTNDSFDPNNDKIRIKFSGDGAKMTNKSNFVLLSFSILDSGKQVMSAKGNRTLAGVDGGENYETMKDAFAPLLREMNALISQGYITMDGKRINTEFFLGGDYKFILLMLGLKSAISTYSCAWCKVKKEDRWKLYKSLEEFNTPPLCRSLNEIKRNSTNKDSPYGCEHEPLLEIELDHVLPDELHLLLRITDILLENLITSSIDWDKELELDRRRGQLRGVKLAETVTEIRSCGITFDVWQEKTATKKETGNYKWTSLRGDDKKKLLHKLPKSKNFGLLFKSPDTAETVRKIWHDFGCLYSVVTAWSPEQSPIDFWKDAVKWINLFLSLNGKVIGHEKKRVTPYMHILVAHVPHFLQLYKTMKLFTGQGVEKNNDNARAVVLKKSNKWDSVGDVLRLEARQWELRDRDRVPGSYVKRNSQYWEEDIRNKSRKHVDTTYHN